jgi:hypothetical protein
MGDQQPSMERRQERKPVYSPPGEWNFFGTNGCYFVQYQDKKSRITGGATARFAGTARRVVRQDRLN